MKHLVLFIVVSILLVSCSKDNHSNNSGIIIKGSIPKDMRKSAANSTDESLSLSDAKKVLVFSKYYFDLYDITDGSFSASGQIGTGVGLIFLDADNKYIGNLAAHGLNMLPLGSLSEGENTVIDLSTLTLAGNSVIPSHDPFGNEIQITEAEISRLKVIDSYYEAIAKNIDVDNDGRPDVLDDKELIIFTMFTINGGHWGINSSAPVPTDSDHYYVNYGLEFSGGSALTFTGDKISVSGPAGDPYTDIKLWGYRKAPECADHQAFISSFCRETRAQPDAPWGSAFLPFKKGTYTLTLDDTRDFTLSYSSVDLGLNLVIVSPTLHTNSEGMLTSITFDYKLPDGTTINPASVLTNVMVQLNDNQYRQFYVNDKSKLTCLTGFNELKLDSPVDISGLHHIDLWYDDLLGNQYDIIWR